MPITVLGYDAAFNVTVPVGWDWDDTTSRYGGVQAVLFPSAGESSWDREETVISGFVSGQGEVFNATFSSLTTADGRRVRVGDDNMDGLVRRTAWIDTPDVDCRLVLSAPNQAAFDSTVPVFEGVVRSFRFLPADSGEFQAARARRRLIDGSVDIQNLCQWARPEGWRRERGAPGVALFSRTEGTSFGLIAAYDAKPAGKDIEADYAAAWRELAETVYQAGPPPPAVPLVTHDGYEQRFGTVRLADGRVVSLAVLSGVGRRFTVVACYNNESFASAVKDFIRFVQPRLTMRGQWTFREGNPEQIVEGRSMRMIEPESASRSYSFQGPNFLFEGELSLDAERRMVLSEKGTWSISGNRLTFHGQGGTQRVTGPGKTVSTRVLPTWERTYTFRLLDFPDAIHGPFLVLEGVPENDIDGTYSRYTPKAFVYVRGYH